MPRAEALQPPNRPRFLVIELEAGELLNENRGTRKPTETGDSAARALFEGVAVIDVGSGVSKEQLQRKPRGKSWQVRVRRVAAGRSGRS